VKTLRHVLEYFFFQCTSAILGLLPLQVAWKVGGSLGEFAYAGLGFRRTVIRENLRMAFPELGEEDRERIARGSFRNVGMSLMELMWLPRLTGQSVKSLVDFEGREVLEQCLRRGKGAVLLTAHIGNWEMVPISVQVALGIPVHSLYKPQSNPWIDRKIRARRTKFGTRVIPMGMGIREILRVLQSGECVLIAADQSAPKESIRMKFFGREVPVFQGPAVFCLKTGAAMVASYCMRISDDSYKLEFKEIATSDLSTGDDSVRELTRRHLEETERVIRRYPDQWMWMHRRWKHSGEGE